MTQPTYRGIYQLQFLKDILKNISSYVLRFCDKRSNGNEKLMFLFGVIFFFNYPIYYLIWTFAEIQSYENLTIRILASLICVPLICVRYWPKKVAKYLPVYWYFAVTFCLPFFFTFMTIMNQASMAWLLNLILALLLIFILLDLASLCLTVLIGAAFAFLCFAYLSPIKLSLNSWSVDLIGVLTIYIAPIVVGGVFARNREIITAKKMRRQSEAANKAKTEFIANMSHDIRTPITGIVGLAQDLLNQAETAKKNLEKQDGSDKKLYEMSGNLVNLIQKDGQLLIGAADELLQLCNEILETINLESGRAVAKSESFNVRDLMQQNVGLFAPAAKNKQLNLFLHVDDDVPPYLYGLRKYLYRCVLNLVSNALKFTESGHVKIIVHTFERHDNSITLRIIVEDTGAGIPSDKIDVIFEHFSRLTPSFEGVYKGSGLGLYTVKQYVKAMEGKISVDSEPGKGTRFILDAPFIVSDHSKVDKESICLLSSDEFVASNSNANRVLVVEDNALAAIAVKAMLKPFDLNIDIAETGDSAVIKAQEETYALILMDIGLPDFSGIEVTKRIRALSDPVKSQVPIVALTGHANQPEMRKEALQAGMQAVISKPAQVSDLKAVLQKYV